MSLPIELLMIIFNNLSIHDLMLYSKYFQFAKIVLKIKLKDNKQISLRLAAQYGCLDIIKEHLDNNKMLIYCDISSLADDAAEYGQLYTLKWLIDNEIYPTQYVRNLTAYNGHLHILVWLDKYYPIKYQRQMSLAMYFAIKSNYLNIVKYFVYQLLKLLKTEEEKNNLHVRIFREACEYGKIDIVKWVLEQRYNLHTETDKPNAIDFAASNGHLDIIELLYKKGYNATQHSIQFSAQKGYLHVLKWFKSNTTLYNDISDIDYSVIIASKNDYLEIVKWLIQNIDYPQDILNIALDTATLNGCFEIVKWLKQNTTAQNKRWFPIH